MARVVQTVYASAMPKEVKKPGRLMLRLSAEDEAYLDAVSAKLGLTKSGVLMMGLRLVARKHRIAVEGFDAPEAPGKSEEE